MIMTIIIIIIIIITIIIIIIIIHIVLIIIIVIQVAGDLEPDAAVGARDHGHPPRGHGGSNNDK